MMENKFTPRAEESLRLAQEAAEEMGHGYVGSEHLLLGLMREEEGIAHRVLEEAGLTDDMICDVLHRSVGTGLSGAAPSQGLTPRAKSAVELAVSEASRTGAGYIGTEHLLMGLLREGNNMAIRVLRTVGIDPKKLYSAVVKKINEAPRAAAAAGGNSAAPSREDGKKGGALAEFTRDLTADARAGKLGGQLFRARRAAEGIQKEIQCAGNTRRRAAAHTLQKGGQLFHHARAQGLCLRQLLRLLAFVQISASDEQPINSCVKSACYNIITVFRKLRTGQINADIKHPVLHMTTALTGG